MVRVGICSPQRRLRYFSSQGYEITLVTDERGMRFGEHFKGYNITELPTVNVRSGGIIKRIKSSLILIKSIFIALKLTWKIKPELVLGFGGYPSFPAGMAAALTRTPLFLHEQNAIIGRTNKFLAFAKKILCSFKNTKGVNIPRDDQDKFQILVKVGLRARIFTEIMPLFFKMPRR